MSVRRRRFGRIKQAIKNGASGGYLDKYKSYVNGTTTITRTMPQRGNSRKIAISTFGLNATEGPIWTRCSGRAYTNIGLFGLSDAELGWATDTTDAQSNAGYQPAKVICKKFTGTASPKLSDITGLTYQRRAGESSTYPFGKKTGSETEFEATARLAGTITLFLAESSVTFQPERMYAS